MSGEKSTFECVVSADLFRRALLGVSTEETRYYLNGVHIAAAPEGGATLVATNGSFLIAIRDPAAFVRGAGIVQLTKPMVAALKTPRGLLGHRLLIAKAAAPKNASDQRGYVVDVEGDEPIAYAAARQILDAPDSRVASAQHGDLLIDGTFPNWRMVIPDAPDASKPVPPLNLVLLSRAAEALATSKHSRDVHLTASGPNEPVLVTSAESRRFDGFAIVMPIRTSGSPGSIPLWAKRPKDKPVAEAA